MVGEKIQKRLQAIPKNIQAAAEDVRRKSVAEAVANIPRRFGEENRKLMD